MSRYWLARLACRLAGVIGASSLMAAIAQAATFTQNGPIASLSGPITAGDDLRLNAFLHRPEAAQIRLLYLNSPGGMVYEAYKMSEIVRAANLSTAVDASHAYCASACTALFVAGVRRYYLNAQTIVDGDPRQKRGLGSMKPAIGAVGVSPSHAALLSRAITSWPMSIARWAYQGLQT